ncbi:MFS transporter [Streptomyces sp. Lzd4kr]|nr:MFS transporter [Streptomyces sp. Lzd4kr]
MVPWIRVALALFVVGWGANQFAPLLLVYREGGGVAETTVTVAFAAYAAGLIPTLLVAVSVADRVGRLPVMRVVLILSALASAILLVGGNHAPALIAGRLLAGVASGGAFGPGTAWIKEVSGPSAPGVAARRAAISLTAGFGGGPLVAGVLGQWSPAPEAAPYAAHILLTLVITVLAWNTPETLQSTSKTPAGPVHWRGVFRYRPFLREVAPTAPLVFGAATTSFAILPGLVPVHGPHIAVSGGMAALTLGSGVAVQPVCHRLAARTTHAVRYAGLIAASLGLLVAAAAVFLKAPVLLVPGAVLLGACYGILLVAGLTRIESVAAPQHLAPAIAVFYCLTYLGFSAPYVVTELKDVVTPALFLVVAAAVSTLLIPATASRSRTAQREAVPKPSPPAAGTGGQDVTTGQRPGGRPRS